MRTRVILAAAVAALSLASAANAATTSGTVKTYDPENRQLVLENGYRYLLPSSFQTTELKTGDQVTIRWSRMQNGIRVAQNVQVANQPANND